MEGHLKVTHKNKHKDCGLMGCGAVMVSGPMNLEPFKMKLTHIFEISGTTTQWRSVTSQTTRILFLHSCENLTKLSIFSTSIFLKIEDYHISRVVICAGKYNASIHTRERARTHTQSLTGYLRADLSLIQSKSLCALCHYNLHVICTPLISSNRILGEYIFIKVLNLWFIWLKMKDWIWPANQIGDWTYMFLVVFTAPLCFLTTKSDLHEKWA